MSSCPKAKAEWLQNAIRNACKVDILPQHTLIRQSTYWWSSEISNLRAINISMRRRFTRARRKGANTPAALSAHERYHDSRADLKHAITAAKEKVWDDMLSSLDEIALGKSYKIMLKKLNQSVPNLRERLHSDFLCDILLILYPFLHNQAAYATKFDTDWTSDSGLKDLQCAINKMTNRDLAPGTDGVSASILKVILAYLDVDILSLFNLCLRRGTFSFTWKMSSMVLLQKRGTNPNDESSYTSIYLISEVCKLFERIIVLYIQDYVKEEKLLSERLFRFHTDISTTNEFSIKHTVSRSSVGD